MKKTTLARKSKNPANIATRKKKKETWADFARLWELGPQAIKAGPDYLRYRGAKGVAWFWFARYIRMRDFKEWGMCISCGKSKTFEELQAGHFMPAGSCGLSLLMDEKNVNGECGGCNGFDESHLVWYAEGLDKRFGVGTAESLKERYQKRHQTTIKISELEWENLAHKYKSLFQENKEAQPSSAGQIPHLGKEL